MSPSRPRSRRRRRRCTPAEADNRHSVTWRRGARERPARRLGLFFYQRRVVGFFFNSALLAREMPRAGALGRAGAYRRGHLPGAGGTRIRAPAHEMPRAGALDPQSRAGAYRRRQLPGARPQVRREHVAPLPQRLCPPPSPQRLPHDVRWALVRGYGSWGTRRRGRISA